MPRTTGTKTALTVSANRAIGVLTLRLLHGLDDLRERRPAPSS